MNLRVRPGGVPNPFAPRPPAGGGRQRTWARRGRARGISCPRERRHQPRVTRTRRGTRAAPGTPARSERPTWVTPPGLRSERGIFGPLAAGGPPQEGSSTSGQGGLDLTRPPASHRGPDAGIPGAPAPAPGPESDDLPSFGSEEEQEYDTDSMSERDACGGLPRRVPVTPPKARPTEGRRVNVPDATSGGPRRRPAAAGTGPGSSSGGVQRRPAAAPVIDLRPTEETTAPAGPAGSRGDVDPRPAGPPAGGRKPAGLPLPSAPPRSSGGDPPPMDPEARGRRSRRGPDPPLQVRALLGAPRGRDGATRAAP